MFFPKKNLPHWEKCFSYFCFLLIFCFLGFFFIFGNKDTSSQKKLSSILNFGQLLPTPYPYPVNKNVSPFPPITAESVFVIDADSEAVLYEKNATEKVAPASTTKIMTALVSLENYRLDQVLTVENLTIDGNKIDLKEGEQVTVENLLYGMLVGSGNDAAEVLADNFSQGKEGFVWAMNQKAKEFGLEDTNFTNPIGLDEENHYSTAKDLARLTSAALKNPIFARIVATVEIEFADTTGKITYKLKSTNELIDKIDGVKGVKTGWTESAKECLVTLVERDNKKIILVILGSEDRFGETKSLIDWVFENFEWQFLAPAKDR